MDADLRQALRSLCRAINDSVKDSARIACSVEQLQAMGYDFTLMLEATLMLGQENAKLLPKTVSTRRAGRVSLTLNDTDQQYLRSLNITVKPPKTARKKRPKQSP